MKIIITVTNDLETDNRMHKTALILKNAGYNVCLVGRKLPSSSQISRVYDTHRLNLIFKKSALFYAFFNLRLFFYLLFKKFDVVLSCDLDSLPAARLASVIKSKHLVYDSHELFTELPELQERKFVKLVWEKIEKSILPKIKYAFTVSDKIAEYYKDKYGIEMKVLRNFPMKNPEQNSENIKTPAENYIIYQGAVNEGRGLDKLIRAMDFIHGLSLIIAGDGPEFDRIEKLVISSKSRKRISLTGRLDFRTLNAFTKSALIGISLEQDIGLNYRYALPNKLFDYIKAGIPVLVSDLPEMGDFVRKTETGITVDPEIEPEELADKINKLLSNKEAYKKYAQNCIKAGEIYTWEKESLKELEVFRTIAELSKINS